MIIENLLDNLKLEQEKVESNELVQTCIRLLDETKNDKIDKQISVKNFSKNSVIRYLNEPSFYFVILNFLKTLITSV
jgi:hypothetical protein